MGRYKQRSHRLLKVNYIRAELINLTVIPGGEDYPPNVIDEQMEAMLVTWTVTGRTVSDVLPPRVIEVSGGWAKNPYGAWAFSTKRRQEMVLSSTKTESDLCLRKQLQQGEEDQDQERPNQS